MLHNLSLLNLITSILGFVVVSLLVFSARQNRFVNFILGIGFFALAYRSLSVYALQENLVGNTFVIGTVSFIYYLIPPVFYLYFRAVINDEQSLKKGDWVHFLFPCLAVVLLIYYLIAEVVNSGGFKLPLNEAPFGNRTDITFYIQPGIHAFVIFNLGVIYTFLSWRMVLQKLRSNVKEHPQVSKMRTWVLTLLITCTLLLVVLFYGGILKIVFNRDIVPFANPHIVRSLVLIFIFSRVLFKTDLLFGIPDLKTHLPVVDSLHVDVRFDEPEVIEHNDLGESDSDSEKESPVFAKEEKELYFDKYGWIHMKEDEKELTIQNAATAFIEKDKVIAYIELINKYIETAPYTNPDFDIKTISQKLQSPLYHVEYLFRYYNKYSFSEFRNVMRVQYVLDNFNKGQLKNYTLEAIGLQAGFNSRSSFFRVFKIITGKTPKQILDAIPQK